jgi:hypothetical protein
MRERWTTGEDIIILEYYGNDICSKLLPHRTDTAIAKRAHDLGLGVTNRGRERWTAYEEQILRENDKKIGMGELLKLLPKRSCHAIRTHAHSIGLTIVPWSPEEDRILIENSSMGDNVYELLPGRDKYSCIGRIQHLKHKAYLKDHWEEALYKHLFRTNPEKLPEYFKENAEKVFDLIKSSCNNPNDARTVKVLELFFKEGMTSEEVCYEIDTIKNANHAWDIFEIGIKRMRRPRYLRILKNLPDTSKKIPGSDLYVDAEIEVLRFSARTYNALTRRNNICTVGELVSKSKDDLLKMWGISTKTLEEIELVLYRNGLKLLN